MFSLRFIVTLSNFDSFWPHRPTWLRIKVWVYRKSFTNRLWWHRVRCWPACRMYWDLHPLLGDTITSLISGTLPEYFRYRSEVINRDWTILLSLFSDGKNGSELDTFSLWPVDWGCVVTVPHSFSWHHEKVSRISPIWYGFRASTKAIRYSAKKTCVLSLYVSTATQYQMSCHLHATGYFYVFLVNLLYYFFLRHLSTGSLKRRI